MLVQLPVVLVTCWMMLVWCGWRLLGGAKWQVMMLGDQLAGCGHCSDLVLDAREQPRAATFPPA